MIGDWTRTPIKPTHLSPGDRVAIVTPCWGGPASFPERYEAGKRSIVQLFGLDLVEMPHVRADPSWLDRNL